MTTNAPTDTIREFLARHPGDHRHALDVLGHAFAVTGSDLPTAISLATEFMANPASPRRYAKGGGACRRQLATEPLTPPARRYSRVEAKEQAPPVDRAWARSLVVEAFRQTRGDKPRVVKVVKQALRQQPTGGNARSLIRDCLSSGETCARGDGARQYAAAATDPPPGVTLETGPHGGTFWRDASGQPHYVGHHGHQGTPQATQMPAGRVPATQPANVAPGAPGTRQTATTAGGQRGQGSTQSVEEAAADYQAHGTRSRAFTSWFGDWLRDPASASKVVNRKTGEPQLTHPGQELETGVAGPDGQPVAVFHGTAFGGYNEFRRDKIQDPNMLLYGPGFYFTESREIAGTYTQKDVSDPRAATPKVYEVYLNVRRPFDAERKNVAPDERKRVLAAFDAELGRQGFLARMTHRFDPNISEARRLLSSDLPLPANVLYQALFTAAKSKTFANNVLRESGFDGITHIGGQVFGVQKPGATPIHHRVWICFEPNQVKSRDNRGTFDPTTNRIDYGEHDRPRQYQGATRPLDTEQRADERDAYNDERENPAPQGFDHGEQRVRQLATGPLIPPWRE